MVPSPSPNFNDRQLPVTMLVMHYTGMQSGEEALSRLCDSASQVSAHYLVEEDGRVFQLVDEDKRAWHAGKSGWRDITDVNSASIGIEIVNPGHEFGYRPFPHKQMDAVLELSQDILKRHAIPARNIVGHSDVAPSRKEDPGEFFDWHFLADHGVGLWPEIEGVVEAVSNEEALTHQLKHYGYVIDNDNSLHDVVVAFQRHFRRGKVDGEWDVECEAVLASLLHLI